MEGIPSASRRGAAIVQFTDTDVVNTFTTGRTSITIYDPDIAGRVTDPSKDDEGSTRPQSRPRCRRTLSCTNCRPMGLKTALPFFRSCLLRSRTTCLNCHTRRLFALRVARIRAKGSAIGFLQLDFVRGWVPASGDLHWRPQWWRGKRGPPRRADDVHLRNRPFQGLHRPAAVEVRPNGEGKPNLETESRIRGWSERRRRYHGSSLAVMTSPFRKSGGFGRRHRNWAYPTLSHRELNCCVAVQTIHMS